MSTGCEWAYPSRNPCGVQEPSGLGGPGCGVRPEAAWSKGTSPSTSRAVSRGRGGASSSVSSAGAGWVSRRRAWSSATAAMSAAARARWAASRAASTYTNPAPSPASASDGCPLSARSCWARADQKKIHTLLCRVHSSNSSVIQKGSFSSRICCQISSLEVRKRAGGSASSWYCQIHAAVKFSFGKAKKVM